MSITLFGSCRINSIKNHNNLNNLTNYTHSTKECLQLIKFLKGELIFPKPYNILCFRTGISNNRMIELKESYQKSFDNTKYFFIEICSKKNYIHNNFYLHHLCFAKNKFDYYKNTPLEILNNFKIINQSDEEIENDILEIQKILFPKKIIIISHFNIKQENGEFIESRNYLINLLDTICKKHSIPFINPTNVFSNFKQDKILHGIHHYNNFAYKFFSNYVDNFIKNLE